MSTYERFGRLVRCTALLIREQRGELELDDIEQTLWLRVCRVVPRFKADRGMSLEQYVFMCLTDAKKDILKRPRRKHSSLEEIRCREWRSGAYPGSVTVIADWFDRRFASFEEPGFSEAEVAELIESLPVGPLGRRFLRLRVAGLRTGEAGRVLGRGDEGYRVTKTIRRCVGDPDEFMEMCAA